MPVAGAKEAKANVAARMAKTALGVAPGGMRTAPVSPAESLQILEEFSASGSAQVIAVLKTPYFAAEAAATSLKSPQLDDFRKYFVPSPLDVAIAASMTAATGVKLGSHRSAKASPITAPPVRIFPNLGVMLGNVTPQTLQALRRDSRVAAVTGAPQFSLVRPRSSRPIAKKNHITWGLEFLEIPALWNQGYTGKGIIVAHLDTGVDGRHPTLRGSIANFAEFDHLGNEVNPTPAPYDGDAEEGHGTHTAATIVGRTAKGFTMGVAPDAKLASALVVEGGNIVARILNGLDWALSRGAKVLSMSVGLRGWREDFVPVIQILRARGVLPVIAVGNEGPGTSRSPGNYAESLSVGAMDQHGVVADFSSSQRFNRQKGPIAPDLVAPGVKVISAVPRGGLAEMDGTSMATPHIAGLAALLYEARPGATVDQIEDAIFKSCKLLPGMAQERAGLGVPNGPRALAILRGREIAAQISSSKVKYKKPKSEPKLSKKKRKSE
jgi:subtilisin